eukprot:g29662.t1
MQWELCGAEEVHSEHSNQSKASHASETAEKAHRHAHEKVTVRVRTLEDVMKGDESGTSSMASMDWVRQKGDALCMGGFDKKPEELWGALPCFRVRLLGRCQEDEDEEEDPLKISSIYTFLFTSELLLRILVRGIRIFWGEDWGWMLLDAAIVISSLFEFVIEVIVSSSNDTEQANVFTNMRLLRILRVAKITRAFRIVRLVRFIRSLRTLLLCIGRTLRAMAWSAVLLLLIMFLFALIFTDLCTEHIAQYGLEGKYGEFLDRRAGSLMDSMHTLYASITGGFTWIEVRDAFDDISPAWGLLFEAYIAFCNFAVLNDHELNLESVSQEKEKYFRAVRRLFTQLDQNSDGGITRKEFERAWKDPVLQTVFDALEISSTDAWDLFRQLDRDGSGEVDVDEFLEGCMMIKGPARSIDVVCIKKDLIACDFGPRREPFLLDDLPGKQAAQKGRNNKKQILAPGALSRGAGQVPGLSELLEGSRVGNAGGKKNANGKALQGMAKSKNAKGKQPKTQDMASPMIAMPQFQMQQWLQAAASMGACGACGVPMPMMAGGFPMQAMQPTMYDGMDANVLMAGMMPFAGNVDMSQYMAAFGTQSYPYSNGDAFEYSDMRGAENQEEEE